MIILLAIASILGLWGSFSVVYAQTTLDYVLDNNTVPSVYFAQIQTNSFDWVNGQTIDARAMVTQSDYDTATGWCSAGGVTRDFFTPATTLWELVNLNNAACTIKDTGTYYTVFKNISTGSKYYVQFYWDKDTQTVTKEIPVLSGTRISGDFMPAVGYFDPATTTTVDISFNYVSGLPVASIVGIQLQNIGINFQYIPQIEIVTQSGSLTFSTTTPELQAGVYQWRAVLSGDDFNYYSPWRLFSIGTSPDQSFIPVPNSEEFQCDNGGWIENSLCSFFAWAFIPPATTMNGVLEIWQGLREVKPFGYIVQVIDLRGSMQMSDPDYTLGELPLQTAIFDPIRAGIAVLLWVFFLFYLYNRFKTMDI